MVGDWGLGLGRQLKQPVLGAWALEGQLKQPVLGGLGLGRQLKQPVLGGLLLKSRSNAMESLPFLRIHYLLSALSLILHVLT